jgi:hypothetical protein
MFSGTQSEIFIYFQYKGEFFTAAKQIRRG